MTKRNRDEEIELFNQVFSEDISRARELLEQSRVHPNEAQNAQQRRVFHEACRQRHLEMIKLLIQHGADLELREEGYRNRTPLHCAACHGFTEILQLLVDRGANLEANDSKGETPLHRACNNGHLEATKLLVQAGGQVNAKDNHGRTPLHLSCLQGHVKMSEFLIHSSGANVNAKITNGDKQGQTPLYIVCAAKITKQRLMIAKLLLEQGANVNDKYATEKEETALHVSCGNKGDLHVQVTKFLIQHGADVNAKDKHGETPLHRATSMILLAREGHGSLEVVQFLLDSGADVNAKRHDDGNTVLHWACGCSFYYSCLDLVKLLLSRGANVNAETTEEGLTPLHVACRANRRDIVWLLLRQNPWLVVED